MKNKLRYEVRRAMAREIIQVILRNDEILQLVYVFATHLRAARVK